MKIWLLVTATKLGYPLIKMAAAKLKPPLKFQLASLATPSLLGEGVAHKTTSTKERSQQYQYETNHT
jgi:hypothetical protein